MNGNNLLMGTGVVDFSGSTVGSGRMRFSQGTNMIVGRNNAGSADVVLMTWGVTADTIVIGASGSRPTRRSRTGPSRRWLR